MLFGPQSPMMHPAAPSRRRWRALEIVSNEIANRPGHAFDHPIETRCGVFLQGNLEFAVLRQLNLAAISTVINFNQLPAASETVGPPEALVGRVLLLATLLYRESDHR